MLTNVRNTSIHAYYDHLSSGKLGDQGRQIMLALHQHNRDWSLQEISQLTGIAINAVSGRVNGLKAKGYLIECPKRKCSVTGRTVTPVKINMGCSADEYAGRRA